MKGLTKTCLLCHTQQDKRLRGVPRGEGGKSFCGKACRRLYDLISGSLLLLNPRIPPKGVRLFLLQRDHFRCKYCGRRVSWGSANIDHIKAWPKGKTRLENLTTSCRPCNRAKYVNRIPDKRIREKVRRGLQVDKRELQYLDWHFLWLGKLAPTKSAKRPFASAPEKPQNLVVPPKVRGRARARVPSRSPSLPEERC